MQFGICNEIFKDWPLEDTMAFARKVGYDALEIAPFTLAKYVTDIPSAARRKVRDDAARAGLGISGIHWVLAQAEGMYLNHPDASIRACTAKYLCDLVDFCAELGGKTIVFGSPKQRATTGGLTREEATRNYIDGLASVAPHAVERNVTILVEALPLNQWTRIATNQFDLSGDFIFTNAVNAGLLQSYFRLQLP